jgi:hypothetical protein
MRSYHYLVLSLLVFSAPAADDFRALYNGKDLTGWHVKDAHQGLTFGRANGKILTALKDEQGAGGRLTTDKEYGDFVLRLAVPNQRLGDAACHAQGPDVGASFRSVKYPFARPYLTLGSRSVPMYSSRKSRRICTLGVSRVGP